MGGGKRRSITAQLSIKIHEEEHGRGSQIFSPACPRATSDTKIAYWYGEDEEKDLRSNIRFIRRYFPQIQLHVFPRMAHAELVIVYPEEFLRYAEEFLMQEE